jgi:hypothetical protein
MKTHEVSGGIGPPLLTLVLDRGEQSASRTGSVMSWGNNPQYPLDKRHW